MSDNGMGIIAAGILNGFLAAMPPGACDSAGRCWAWTNPPPRVIIAPQPYPVPYPAPMPQTQYQSPPPRKDPQEARLRDMIVQFCNQHPEEAFCGELDVWFQRHPEDRR
jgi:hypothetical protein